MGSVRRPAVMGLSQSARVRLPPAMNARTQLSFQLPFDWAGLLLFLKPRAIAGVEQIELGELRRCLRQGDRTGWLRIWQQENQLWLETNLDLSPTSQAASRVLDLAAPVEKISSVLRQDSRLGKWVTRWPGIRVPGAWDPFEMGVRAILGQQISVRAAHTLAGRIVERWGESVPTPWPEVRRLFPTPQRLRDAGTDAILQIGLPRRRAETLYAFAQWSAQPEPARVALTDLPGIGPWTENYLKMRSSIDRDSFPAGDLGIHKALGLAQPGKPKATREAEILSQAWRPWRSYAVFLLWRSLAEPEEILK